ncbi:MAG TPA: hypothetical protein VLM38_02615 [Blastocatellia bacterium]|nr:hypothetical protein [Blastocatellia bacterium]
MSKQSAHPDSKFLDYLSGKTEGTETRLIEEHLSSCDECASAAALVRAIKNTVSDPGFAPSHEHPDASELASFFYASSPQEVSSPVAKHVAHCVSCAEAMAQYAAAECAASERSAASARSGGVPAKAWEMIREWEESSFAELKPASEVLSGEFLEELSRALRSRERERPELNHSVSESRTGERIPVLVVNQSGELHGVEYFEQEIDSTGARVLRHTEGSVRFDNRLVHVLLDVGENEPVLVSELIESDTLRLERASNLEGLRRVDYFIVDESEE